MTMNYFCNVFDKENHFPPHLIIHLLVLKSSIPFKGHIQRPYEDEEIKQTVFSMGALKAPRVDGIHAIFF